MAASTLLLLAALSLLVTRSVAQGGSDFPPPSFYAKHADNPAIFVTATSPDFSGTNRSFGLCSCSPSSRGHPPLSDPDIANFTTLMREFASLPDGSLRARSFQRKLNRVRVTLFERYGTEGYVNLDARLRPVLPLSHCLYHIPSGRNVYVFERTEDGLRFISMRSCSDIEGLAASSEQLKLLVASPGPSPPPREGAESTSAPDASPGAEEFTASPSPLLELPSPAVVPPSLPSRPLQSPAPQVDTVGTFGSARPTPRNEGCVAVEHLVGCAVQHARPLMREVLCARGFCATPNHAVIVDDVWTSMKRMCKKEWTCTREIRLVNNLKIAQGTRVRFDDRIVITPYDVRFPVAGPWIVQILEDVLALLLLSVQGAALTLFAMAGHLCLSGDVDQKAKAEGEGIMRSGVKRMMGSSCRGERRDDGLLTQLRVGGIAVQ